MFYQIKNGDTTNTCTLKCKRGRFVTVLITTFKRAHLLPYLFSALERQSCKSFDILAIVKPSGDGTENVIAQFQRSLNISMFIQTSGHVVDAIKIGLKHATGDIIAFLDDDAIPSSDWVQIQIENYSSPNIGGLAGQVIPAYLNQHNIIEANEKSSEIIPKTKPFQGSLGRELWNCPLKGLDDYLVYVSKAGIVNYNLELADQAQHQKTKTLLGMGANMSVLAKALEGLQFSDSWVLGLSYEQFIGWHIWKKGYTIIFNPKAKVYHLSHGQTLSRNVTDKKKDALRQIEDRLLFYRLYGFEPNLSKMHRLTWLIFDAGTDLKKICINREFLRISSFRSKVHSEIIGIKWLLSRRFGGNYCPLTDLEKVLND